MDDRGRDRHCAKCELVVHDVASMTRAEVETLLEARERGERVCLHLFVRESDGAVLVKDGHVERARPAPPSRMIAAAVATAMTACATPPSTVPEPNQVVSQPVTMESSPRAKALHASSSPKAPHASPSLPPPTQPPTPSKKKYVELAGDPW